MRGEKHEWEDEAKGFIAQIIHKKTGFPTPTT